MEQIKKIAVIGGTGKSGKYLVKQLLHYNFHVKILIRNPERFQIQNSQVEVVIGDVIEYKNVLDLVKECQVVISALGLGLPPSDPDIFVLATRNILRAMNEAGVRRYILLTGLNVDVPSDKKGPKSKAATNWMYANYPRSTTARQQEFTILSESHIDWTLVRLPLIEQTDSDVEISVSLEDCPGDKISATSLANFLVAQIMDDAFINKAPFVANKVSSES
jgi:putative NADH-flavin reductase